MDKESQREEERKEKGQMEYGQMKYTSNNINNMLQKLCQIEFSNCAPFLLQLLLMLMVLMLNFNINIKLLHDGITQSSSNSTTINLLFSNEFIRRISIAKQQHYALRQPFGSIPSGCQTLFCVSLWVSFFFVSVALSTN